MVAQLVEQGAVNSQVAGSNPAHAARFNMSEVEKDCVQCGIPLDEDYEETEDFCEMQPECFICDNPLEDAEEINLGVCISCDEEQ